jgi:uncharacterized protein
MFGATRRPFLRALVVMWLVLGAALALAQSLVPVPALSARVTDLTGTLAANEKQALETRLAALEKEKGSQIAVLIVPSTQPEAIEQYSIRVVDQWKLGRQGVDDGALLLIAKNDRRVRIEVGRGLEGAIPDAYAKRIIAEQITPAFRDGRFAAGIDAGVDALIALIHGEPLPAPEAVRSSDAGAADLGDLLFTTVFISFFLAPVLRSIFGRLGGSGVGGVLGAGYWYVSTSVLGMAGLGALVGAMAVLLIGRGGGGGPWTTGSGHGGGFGSSGGGWSSGGGGFSGGGGGFSGGGASGRW